MSRTGQASGDELMPTAIDHLVIGAADLAQGVAYVRQTLGVDIPPGGIHETMGTHNHLMQLGDALFLEVIAINPDRKPPAQPRWFGLDDPAVRRALSQQPALLTWVVNSDSIEVLLAQATIDFGRATRISRGDLSWYFGLPDDGRLLAGGLLPYLIEWFVPMPTHPAARMADTGCRLQGLTLHHPYPSWLGSILESIDAGDLVQIKPLAGSAVPYLEARIQTPSGLKVIRGLGAAAR